jgi:lipopolysaccharide export system permease protein
MKTIDRLLISSFIPPFIVTFSVAMFVLVMQVLWLYIDDIAGKGLSFFLIIELLGYKCVSLIPLALPLAILISSVMVLGNMAERYELSSLKSAGVPLSRIMRPLMFFAVSSVFFSYFTSNNLIPVANLKFGSRMYDIQKQKPTLRLDAGIFNDDFEGFAIHIKEKSGDKGIKDVLIYDHSEASKGRLSQIVAEEGEMYATEDGAFFLMNLRNGHQYMESEPSVSGGGRSYPFIRTNFGSWTKVFDLSEFDLNRTNEELFTSNKSMMTSKQLAIMADSIAFKIRRREAGFYNQMSNYFHYLEVDSARLALTASAPSENETTTFVPDTTQVQKDTSADKRTDSIPENDTGKVTNESASASRAIEQAQKDTSADKRTDSIPENDTGKVTNESASAFRAIEQAQAATKERKAPRKDVKRRNTYEGKPLEQQIDKELTEYRSIIELFRKKRDRDRILGKAKSSMRSIQAHAESAARSLDRMKESRVKHIYEQHTKYSMAVVCFIFLFIGAPMGAIVRKGGFGYPILISILFFMVFIVLTIFCRKIAETFVLPAAAAAWVPCGVLFPVGLFLTTKAMNDSKLINTDRFLKAFRTILNFIKR